MICVLCRFDWLSMNLISMFTELTRDILATHFSTYDVKRLELYSQNMVDYHLIMDLLPSLSRLYFLGQLNVHLSPVQSVRILRGLENNGPYMHTKGIRIYEFIVSLLDLTIYSGPHCDIIIVEMSNYLLISRHNIHSCI